MSCTLAGRFAAERIAGRREQAGLGLDAVSKILADPTGEHRSFSRLLQIRDELLDRIKRGHPDLPVVIISGHGNIETAVAAIKRGAYDYIEKPFKADRLMLITARALEANFKRQPVDWLFCYTYNALVPHKTLMKSTEAFWTKVSGRGMSIGNDTVSMSDAGSGA